jgi:hypothetical protein
MTPIDSFGRFRVYPWKPLNIPDSACELVDLSDINITQTQVSSTANSHLEQRPISAILHPCPNLSTFRLQYWHWRQGTLKSQGAQESLVCDIITQPDFVLSDLSKVNWQQLDNKLAASTAESKGWREIDLVLKIPPWTPAAASMYNANPSVNTYTVPNVPCRSLTAVVREAFTKNSIPHFHYESYKAYYKNQQTSKIHQIYGEVFESQRMNLMDQAIHDIILDEPCLYPRCTAAMMIFSDAMQLSNFGPAKAWPIRVAFGNLSKYERGKPNSNAHYEVGFIPSVRVLDSQVSQLLEFCHFCSSRLIFKTKSITWRMENRFPKLCSRSFVANSFTQSGLSYLTMSSFKHGAKVS